jgi:hypothetical protein
MKTQVVSNSVLTIICSFVKMLTKPVSKILIKKHFMKKEIYISFKNNSIFSTIFYVIKTVYSFLN